MFYSQSGATADVAAFFSATLFTTSGFPNHFTTEKCTFLKAHLQGFAFFVSLSATTSVYLGHTECPQVSQVSSELEFEPALEQDLGLPSKQGSV